VPVVSGSIFVLVLLTYGFWKKNIWAFGGLLVYYALLLVSFILTFRQYSLSDILQMMNYSVFEQTQIISVFSVLMAINIMAVISTLIILNIIIIIYSSRYFFLRNIFKRNRKDNKEI